MANYTNLSTANARIDELEDQLSLVRKVILDTANQATLLPDDSSSEDLFRMNGKLNLGKEIAEIIEPN